MIAELPNNVCIDALSANDVQPDPSIALKSAFLAAFRTDGGKMRSSKLAGVSNNTVDAWLAADPQFAADYGRAVREYQEYAEKTYLIDKLSDPKCPPLLVIFYVKAMWRVKYGDDVKVSDNAAADLIKRLENMPAREVKAAVLEGTKAGVWDGVVGGQ